MTINSAPRSKFSVAHQRFYAFLGGLLAYAAIVCALCAIRPGDFGVAAMLFASSLGRAGGLFCSAMLLLELSLVSYDLIGWQRYVTGHSAELRQVILYPDTGTTAAPLGPVAKTFCYLVFTVMLSAAAYVEAFA